MDRAAPRSPENGTVSVPLKRVIKGLLLFAVSASLFVYVLSSENVDLPRVWDLMSQANVLLVVVAIVFSTLSFALLPTLRWQRTLSAMGYRISFRRLLFVRFGAQPFKFSIPMKGGEAFRAVYLRRRFGVPMAEALGSILFDMFLVAVAQLTFVCIGVALAGSDAHHVFLPAAGVLTIGLVLSSKRFQGWLVRLTRFGPSWLHDRVKQVVHGFLRFPLSTKCELTAMSFVVEFSEVFSVYLCCLALGFQVPMWAVLTYMPIVMAWTLILGPVTIRGFGAREAAFLTLLQGLASPEHLTSAVLLFEFVEFILPAALGCFFLSSFVADLGKTPVAEQSNVVVEATPSSLWTVLAENRRWWLVPFLFTAGLFLLFLWLTKSGAVTPFVY